MYKSMGAKHSNWQLSQNNQYNLEKVFSVVRLLRRVLPRAPEKSDKKRLIFGEEEDQNRFDW